MIPANRGRQLYSLQCEQGFGARIGFAYTGQYGVAGFARRGGGLANDPRCAFGARLWY